MDVRLCKAAFKGNVDRLKQLIQGDSQLLGQALQDCSAKNNPLHIAARLGHSDFVKEILTHQSQFAREMNSEGQTPLHLAAGKGHLKVVEQLFKAYPDACYLHDRDGTIPLHRAAMNGRVEVLKLLVGADMEIAWLLTDQGAPILHLCVHHNQFEALRVLIEAVSSVEFVNMKDDADNTILHLLAAKNQYKVIKFVLTRGVDVNVVNVNGSTAFDVSRENPSGSGSNIRRKIRAILKSYGAKKARKISPAWPKKRTQKMKNEKYQNWLTKMKESLMVVATLMASISFQASLNPPGGVWQDTAYHNSTLDNPKQIPHTAGEAILSYTRPHNYKVFTFSTALGLFASLSLILLLVSGFSFQRKMSIWILIVSTWVAVGSIMATYFVSYLSLIPEDVIISSKFWIAVPGAFVVWCLLIFIVVLAHICRFVWRLLYASGLWFCFFSR